MKKSLLILLSIFIFNVGYSNISIKIDSDTTGGDSPEIHDMGVAISPSHLNFNLDIGKRETKYVTITNDTYKKYSFNIKTHNFGMSNLGKSSMFDEEEKYGLKKWLSCSPTYFEVNPGEKKKIAITVEIPDDELNNHAAWSIITINQNVERKTLDPGEGSGNTIAMGVIPVFSFGVYVYQNPPNVVVNDVDITDFRVIQKDTITTLKISAKNNGDGIGFCNSYVEITNLKTGENRKLHVKKFTILPTNQRDFDFPLPNDIPSGTYSAIGILDFGDNEELEAAELEFEIK